MATPLVQPSKNDVNGGTTGAGKTITEALLTGIGNRLQRSDFVVSGLSCGHSGLNVTVALGEAMIAGYRVSKADAFSAVALNASATNYVWLQVPQDGVGATGASVVVTTSSTPPSGGPSLLLEKATTDGSGVTASEDHRTYQADLWLEPIAWASLQVTGSSISIVKSQGLASVSRSSAGTYTLTLSLPMVGDTEVAGLATPWSMGSTGLYQGGIQRASATTCSFTVWNSGGSAADKDGLWAIAIFGKRTLNL